MTSQTYADVQLIEPVATRNYLNVHYGIWSWLLTKDHKRIGILYLISVTAMFFVGGIFAFLMRLELLTPIMLFVELTQSFLSVACAPNTSTIAFDSSVSPAGVEVPCALMYSI